MGFWLLFFLFVGSTVLNQLLRPKQPDMKGPPSALGDFSLPTAAESRPIPVLWGTGRIKGANVVWYGDLGVQTVKKRVGNWISHQDVTVGYRYSLGIQMALCHGPIDAIVDVTFDEKSPGFASTYGTNYDTLAFWAEGLFGGEESEGGISGNMRVYKGTTTQGGDPYLQSRLGVSLPGYRGVCYAVLQQMYLGATPYIKPIAFTLRRCPNQLGVTAGHENIAGDANPACMLYELFTDTRWGLGLPSSAIDAAAFRAAGETLYTEGLGLSMLVESTARANDLAEEILRHIDGTVFTDPFTGVLTIKLARADYVTADLPLFDESNADDVEFSRPSWAETKNYVRVRFVDRAAGFMERVAYECDLANVQVRGGVIALQEMDYRGFSSGVLAQRVAARDLKTYSYPLARIRLTVNRKGWSLRPGSVFRLAWPALGIAEMVCRVTRISTGELTGGKVTVDAVEDIFNVVWTGNPSVGEGGWTPPTAVPNPLSAQRMEEMPYALADGPYRYLMTLGARGAGIVMGYEVWSDPLGGTAYARTEVIPGCTPYGLLVADLAPGDTSLTVYNTVDGGTLRSVSSSQEDRTGQNILLLDDEMIAYTTVTDNGDGTYTITGMRRGAYDTAARAHTHDAAIWFVSNGAGRTAETPYAGDVTVQAKLLPYNNSGTVAIASAASTTKATASRASRPYCPCGLKMNNASYPATVTGAVTVSWEHRNRTEDTLFSDPAGKSNGIESGCQYRVQWRNASGAIISDVTTTNRSSVYTPATGAWTVRVYTEVISSGLQSKDYLLWSGSVV